MAKKLNSLPTHDGTMPQEVTHHGCARPPLALPEPIPLPLKTKKKYWQKELFL